MDNTIAHPFGLSLASFPFWSLQLRTMFVVTALRPETRRTWTTERLGGRHIKFRGKAEAQKQVRQTDRTTRTG